LNYLVNVHYNKFSGVGVSPTIHMLWDRNKFQTKSQFNQNGKLSMIDLATYFSPCTLTSCLITMASFFQHWSLVSVTLAHWHKTMHHFMVGV